MILLKKSGLFGYFYGELILKCQFNKLRNRKLLKLRKPYPSLLINLRKYQPGMILIDAGYGKNTSFLLELEKRQLKYLGGLAKNRKVTISIPENVQQTMRLDELAQSLSKETFTKVELNVRFA